jgi:hypothetical protein
VAYDNTKNYNGSSSDRDGRNNESLFSKRIKAGKRRTYFFDVRATRGNDYFITITESKKRFDDNGYDRHKMFLYKEDFNKFLAGLTETINYVKTDLMPDFDFDAFNHDNDEDYREYTPNHTNEITTSEVTAPAMEMSAMDEDTSTTVVDEWKM